MNCQSKYIQQGCEKCTETKICFICDYCDYYGSSVLASDLLQLSFVSSDLDLEEEHEPDELHDLIDIQDLIEIDAIKY